MPRKKKTEEEKDLRKIHEEIGRILNGENITVPVTDIFVHPDNPRMGDMKTITESIRTHGFYGHLIVQKSTGYILAGNHRYQAAVALGYKELPVTYVDVDEDQADRILLMDNKSNDEAKYDDAQLNAFLRGLFDRSGTLEGTGYSEDDITDIIASASEPHDSMQDKFGGVPFSVLDARAGWWQDRKKAWIAKGLQSEIGRGGELVYNVSSQPVDTYKFKEAQEAAEGRKIPWKEFAERFPDKIRQGGTSIFDPTLCELIVRWFSAVGGRVLDPFAGGSVRGVVSAMLGRSYTGIELREEQVESNRQQWSQIGRNKPTVYGAEWIVGDSNVVLDGIADEYDLVVTCPPYYDLEVYSDDPNDLSNMDDEAFDAVYTEIMRKAASKLKENRFAAVVVGNVRRGQRLADMCDLTTRAMANEGLVLYNDAILLTVAGSLAIRTGKQFVNSRKLGRTHQYVLIYLKGDASEAARACGHADFEVPLETGEEED